MAFPHLFNKGYAAYYLLRLCSCQVVSAILTRNERHCSRFRNRCLWLVDHSYDSAI